MSIYLSGRVPVLVAEHTLCSLRWRHNRARLRGKLETYVLKVTLFTTTVAEKTDVRSNDAGNSPDFLIRPTPPVVFPRRHRRFCRPNMARLNCNACY